MSLYVYMNAGAYAFVIYMRPFTFRLGSSSVNNGAVGSGSRELNGSFVNHSYSLCVLNGSPPVSLGRLGLQ